MRRFILVGGVILAVMCCRVQAQEGQDATPKPTEHHKALAREVGTWDATLKLWMGGPGTDPTESKGVETNTLMKGGLWLLSDFKGEAAGMEFVGRGSHGYDTLKNKHVSTWIDSMSTSLMVSEGTYDEKTKSLTMMSEGFDPQTKKPTTTKTVSTYKDDDHRGFTMYMKSADTNGEFVKVMEINYTRKK